MLNKELDFKIDLKELLQNHEVTIRKYYNTDGTFELIFEGEGLHIPIYDLITRKEEDES